MLRTYYKKAVLIPSGIVLAGNLVYLFIDATFSTYKSEWLTADSFFPIMVLMAVMNALIIALLSLTIFLNQYPQIKSKSILSALAWFICPVTWIAIILIKGGSDLFNFKDGVDSAGIFAIINTVPYLIGLILSYIQLRNNLKSNLTLP